MASICVFFVALFAFNGPTSSKVRYSLCHDFPSLPECGQKQPEAPQSISLNYLGRRERWEHLNALHEAANYMDVTWFSLHLCFQDQLSRH